MRNTEPRGIQKLKIKVWPISLEVESMPSWGLPVILAAVALIVWMCI